MRALLGKGEFRPGVGGTTTCVVADRFGNMVAATPSANVDASSDGGVTGVTFGNRLTSFNTKAGHPNCIEAGKRPRVTLTPTMILKGGKPSGAISVAGGDMQDQIALGLLLGVLEFDLSPAEAVVAPRFVSSLHQDSFNPDPDRQRAYTDAGTLRMNDTIDAGVRSDLATRGHVVEMSPRHIGAPSMLLVDPYTGAASAAGDPAANRHAAGV